VSTFLFVHSPIAPFPRIAGPIPFSNLDRTIGLSIDSFANFSVAGEDLEEEWLRPGMCWAIEQTGEELWAGFVDSQPIPFQADQIDINLVGPKRGLLSIELAIKLPIPVSRGFAVRQALLAAQSENVGMYPGEIEHEGAAVILDVRGETISDFIETVKEAAAGADWREAVIARGNELAFSLDFGQLKRNTNITIGREAVLDGLFTRQPIVSSVTVLGQGAGFEARQATSTIGSGGRTALEATDSSHRPLEGSIVDALVARDIGPAAGRHRIEISERFDQSLGEHAQERHLELLREAEEITLLLDGGRADVRRIRLGDVISLNIPNWALDLSINSRMHVREIHSDEPGGTRELIGNIVL